MSDLYLRAKSIAMEALEQPAQERDAWLAARCGGDGDLLREATWLLAAADTDSGDHAGSGWPLPRPAPAPLDAGARVDASQPGQYRIERLLGEGGMGMVYLAERHDGDSRQQVALKLLGGNAAHDPRLAARMADERRILALLRHPNIAHLIDGGVSRDGRPFIAMEYVEGERIDQWCEARQLPLRARLRLFLKVCAAVEHAHQHLVVHRDLKPGNILVDATGEPKLLDFGIAKLVQGGGADATRTAHRALTLAYASPEHVEGRPLTTATDIWSLGIVLYELLSGARPHQDKEADHLLPGAIVSGEIRPPSAHPRTGDPATDAAVAGTARAVGRIPADIDAIVLKALRTDPSQRYRSVAAMADDIQRFLDSRPVAARRGHAWYRLRRFAWRNRWKLGATAAVLVLAAGYLVDRDRQLREVTAERNKSQALSGFMTDLFANADPSHSRGAQVTVKEVLDRGAAGIRRRDDLPAGERADLLLAMADAYAGLDLHQDALPLALEALRLERAGGSPRIDMAEAIQRLADIHANMGENAQAIASAREGQALLSRDDPDQFPAWARLRMTELRNLDQQGDTRPEALVPLLRGLLAELPASDDEALARTRVNGMEALAHTLLRANDAQGAVRAQEQAVAYAQAHVKDSPETVLSLRGDLGSLLVAAGQAKRGIEVLEAVDRDYVRLIGENAASRATLLNDISAGYEKLGDDARALQAAQKALDVARAALGTQSRLYLQLAISHAISLNNASRRAEAEALLRDTLPHLRARMAPGMDTVNYAYALAALANLLLDAGGDAHEPLDLARKAEQAMRSNVDGGTMIVLLNAIQAEVGASLRLGDKAGARAAVERFIRVLDGQHDPAGSDWRKHAAQLQASIAT